MVREEVNQGSAGVVVWGECTVCSWTIGVPAGIDKGRSTYTLCQAREFAMFPNGTGEH